MAKCPHQAFPTCEPEPVKLLVVEDDASIAQPLSVALRREGFDVALAATGRDAIDAPAVDLVLLDLGLPDLDGHVVCREIRSRSSVPIIVVSARGDEIDRVTLLELGADDYVVKPFGARELVARIRAVLRRSNGDNAATAEPVEIDGLRIDRRSHQVSIDGESIALTPKEYDLLDCLACDPGAVVAREQIMEQVWDENWWGSTKTLDVHVASLRKKIGAERVVTIRGVGFALGVDHPR